MEANEKFSDEEKNCIMCNTKVTYLYKEVINQGIDFVIIGGYGSDYDTMKFEAVLCDTCVKYLAIRQKIKYIGEME